MTKEEAVKILLRYDVNFYPHSASEKEQAIFMAIEALKSSERTAETAQNTSSCGRENDLIFRQAALDAIMGQPPEPHYPSWYAAQIEKIPAAQPDHVADIGKKVEGDCISRQAAIEALARMMPRSYTPDGSHPADEEIFRAQEVFADCIEALEILPSAAPSTAHTTETTAETTAPSTDDWIPVERELPEDLAEVNVTWVNHEPEPYYEPIKSKPFTASAVYYEGNWYWYSSVCADVLAEYGRNDVDKVDDAIEITAWKPLPEPYQGGEKE